MWAKPPSWPITRKGRPAGKPYKTEADGDGLARSPMGCLETRIMPEPAGSGCSECSTASSACPGSLIGSFCSFGPVASSCTGAGDWETESVGPTGEVAGPDGGDVGWGKDSVLVAGGGDGAASTGAFCSTSDWVK